MMNFDEVRNYWEGRAADDSSVQSTTHDVVLREIELRTLTQRLRRYSPTYVADIGCGDGRTTLGLARVFDEVKFVGFDYSSTMIENSKTVLRSQNVSNVLFKRHDVCNCIMDTYDLIYTTRCLINIPSWELQKKALKNIHDALSNNGIYLMIENFVEGQSNFNRVRREFELPEIPIRDHNFFFSRQRLLDYTNDIFTIDEEVNISSTYYLVSRVVYSRICVDSGIAPDYLDVHHRYAANLPFCGEYGPVRLIGFRKK